MYVLLSRSGSNDRFYPADRCTFVTAYNDTVENYVVSTTPQPTFYAGDDANGTGIPGANSTATRAVLGYIGKSGRFVAMTATT